RKLGVRRHVLPPQEEAHEVLCRDRLSGLPERSLGVAVHPGEQTAGHPLRAGCPGAVVTLQCETFSLQRRQTRSNLRWSKRCATREGLGGRYTGQLKVTAQDPCYRRVGAS